MKLQSLSYDFTTKRICEEPTNNHCLTIEFPWHHNYFWVYTIEGVINEFVYVVNEPNFKLSSYKKIDSTSFEYITNDKYVYNVYKYTYEYENKNILTLYKFYLYTSEEEFWMCTCY